MKLKELLELIKKILIWLKVNVFDKIVVSFGWQSSKKIDKKEVHDNSGKQEDNGSSDNV